MPGWRPEEWIERHYGHEEIPNGWYISQLRGHEVRSFEAGADAMLEALRKAGDHRLDETIVVIPDDQEVPNG